jgi:hypothetical protein
LGAHLSAKNIEAIPDREDFVIFTNDINPGTFWLKLSGLISLASKKKSITLSSARFPLIQEGISNNHNLVYKGLIFLI